MDDPVSVPATEVQWRFAIWQDRALTRPVAVAIRGRPRVVPMPVDDFERLRRRVPQAVRTEDLAGGELLDAVSAAEPPEKPSRFDGEVD